jgi:hypothetical protein
MSAKEKWRGLAALVQDAVEHGSRAVERVQKATAQRPFAVLEKIPSIATVAKGVHAIHDASVSSVHGAIRTVNRVAGRTITVVVDAVQERGEGDGTAKATPADGGDPKTPE